MPQIWPETGFPARGGAVEQPKSSMGSESCALAALGAGYAASPSCRWSGDDFVDSGDCVIGRGVFD